MTLASGTSYIEFFQPAQAEGNDQREQTIVPPFVLTHVGNYVPTSLPNVYHVIL